MSLSGRMVNPFNNVKDYHEASLRPMDQATISGDKPGVCYALTLSWLNDLFSAATLNATTFFSAIEDNEFIQSIHEQQSKSTMSNFHTTQFRIDVNEFASEYSLRTDQQHAPAPPPNDISKLYDYFNDGIIKAALIFFITGNVGHVIGVAARGNQFAIFDPNFGEIRFSYPMNTNYLWEVNPLQDTQQPVYVRTYKNALDDLVKYYKENKDNPADHKQYEKYRAIYLKPHDMQYRAIPTSTPSMSFNSQENISHSGTANIISGLRIETTSLKRSASSLPTPSLSDSLNQHSQEIEEKNTMSASNSTQNPYPPLPKKSKYNHSVNAHSPLGDLTPNESVEPLRRLSSGPR